MEQEYDGTVKFHRGGYTVDWRRYTYCGLPSANHIVYGKTFGKEYVTCESCILLYFQEKAENAACD